MNRLELEISRRCAERPGLGRLQARREIQVERAGARKALRERRTNPNEGR